LDQEDRLRLAMGTVLWRIYFSDGPFRTNWGDFRFFGPTQARFDHHLEPPRRQARGILYCADDPTACLAEVFQKTRTINRFRDAPLLAGFAIARRFDLLDLRGAWPTRAGASQAIATGARGVSRRWARVIYDAYPVDGVAYTPSMLGGRVAIALFERVAGIRRRALPARLLLNRPLADPYLLGPLAVAARRVGYRII
jgi:hypothetical protein